MMQSHRKKKLTVTKIEKGFTENMCKFRFFGQFSYLKIKTKKFIKLYFGYSR